MVQMDVARVDPYRSGQGGPPAHTAQFAPHRPAAATRYRGGGRFEVSLLPGGRRPPGPEYLVRWGMANAVERTK